MHFMILSPPPSFCILADDLSGAADCAAAFAPVVGPVPLYTDATLPELGGFAVDAAGRAMDSETAAAAVARIVARLEVGDVQLVFKKIDSTLRGHIAAELRAALEAAPSFAGAVVCPSFAEQGRALRNGQLFVHGVLHRDEGGRVLDLGSMLETSGLSCSVIRQDSSLHPQELAERIARAFRAGVRAVIVDAAESSDLERLAHAVELLDLRVLLAGSAGLARAVARRMAEKAQRRAYSVPGSALHGGCAIGLVGSLSRVSEAQVQNVARHGGAEIVRCDAADWLRGTGCRQVDRALAVARACTARGRNVLFAIDGSGVHGSSQSLVESMARAVAPLLEDAGALLLTGGDTARAVIDALVIEHLEVLGEFEPGISISRPAGRQGPDIYVKAGAFGDEMALHRVFEHFQRSLQPHLGRAGVHGGLSPQ